MFSAWLVPLQPGSWLMSIFAGLGAVPSNLTVPFTGATVAGSMGVAAGAEVSGALLDCSVFSFLLHAPSASSADKQAISIQLFFLFIMSPFHRLSIRCLQLRGRDARGTAGETPALRKPNWLF